MLLHGAAGGVLGLVADVADVDDESPASSADGTGTMGAVERVRERVRVYRLGQALALCPLALLHGLRFYDLALAALQDVRATPELAAVRERLSDLRGLWPQYRRVVLALDRDLWPAMPPPNGVAVYGIGPDRTAAWYLHDIQHSRVCLAERPDPDAMSAGQRALLDQMRERLAEEWSDNWMLGGTGLMLVEVEGVTVRPKPGAVWMSDETVLVRRLPGMDYHVHASNGVDDAVAQLRRHSPAGLTGVGEPPPASPAASAPGRRRDKPGS